MQAKFPGRSIFTNELQFSLHVQYDPSRQAAKTSRTLHGRWPSQQDQPQYPQYPLFQGPSAPSSTFVPAFQPEHLHTPCFPPRQDTLPGQADHIPWSAASAAKPRHILHYRAEAGFSCTKASGSCSAKPIRHSEDPCSPISPSHLLKPSEPPVSPSADSSAKSSRASLTPQQLQQLALEEQDDIIQNFNQTFSSMSISCNTEAKTGSMGCGSLDVSDNMQLQGDAPLPSEAFSSFRQMQHAAMDSHSVGPGGTQCQQQACVSVRPPEEGQGLDGRQGRRIQQSRLRYWRNQQQETHQPQLNQKHPQQAQLGPHTMHSFSNNHQRSIISPGDEPVLLAPGIRPYNPVIQPPTSYPSSLGEATFCLHTEDGASAGTLQVPSTLPQQADLWQLPIGRHGVPAQDSTSTSSSILSAQQHPAAVSHTAAPNLSRTQQCCTFMESSSQARGANSAASLSAGHMEQQIQRKFLASSMASLPLGSKPLAASAELLADSSLSTNFSGSSDQSAACSYQPSAMRAFKVKEPKGAGAAAAAGSMPAAAAALGFSPGIFNLLPHAAANAAALACGFQPKGSMAATTTPLCLLHHSPHNHQQQTFHLGEDRFAQPEDFYNAGVDSSNSTAWRQARPAGKHQLFGEPAANFPGSQLMDPANQPLTQGLANLGQRGRRSAEVAGGYALGFVCVPGRDQAAAMVAKLTAAGGGPRGPHVPACSARWPSNSSTAGASKASSGMAAAAAFYERGLLGPTGEGCSSSSGGAMYTSNDRMDGSLPSMGRDCAPAARGSGRWLSQYEADEQFWKKQLLQGFQPRAAGFGVGGNQAPVDTVYRQMPHANYSSPGARLPCIGTSPVSATAARRRQFKVSAGVQARLARLAEWAGDEGTQGDCNRVGWSGAGKASAEAAVDGGTSSMSQRAAGWSSDESVCGEPAVLSEGEEDNTADSNDTKGQLVMLELTPPFVEDPMLPLLDWKWALHRHREALLAKHKQTQVQKRLSL